MKSFVRLLWLVVIASIPIHRTSSAQDQNLEWKGLLGGVIANAEAWERFDLLMHIERTDSPPNGPTIVMKTNYRLAMDNLEKKCLAIEERIQDSDGERKLYSLKGCMSAGKGKTIEVTFPNDGRKADKDLVESLADMEMINPAAIGLDRFPWKFYRRGMHGDWNVLKNSINVGSAQLKHLGDQAMIRKTSPIVHSGPANSLPVVRRSWKVDTSSLTVKEINTALGLPDGTEKQVFLQDISWKEMNGCYVPVEILHESRESYQPESDAQPSSYFATTFASLHWFSLNEPLKESLLDPKLLESWDSMRSLVDPVKTKADTLIPK